MIERVKVGKMEEDVKRFINFLLDMIEIGIINNNIENGF